MESNKENNKDRGFDDIKKEDTYNDEDDDDIFASVSTQEILHEDVKISNFPHMSKFPVNKQITHASGERPELGEDKNAVSVSEISIENESEEVKSKVNRDEVGKVNNPRSLLVSAGFQTANDNLQETNYKTELKDVKARMSIKSMESKFGKNANKTGFQATFKIHQDNVGKVSPQLCETPNRNSRQTETTELGEFVKIAVEASTPGVNRKLPVQEMEKDNDAIPTANRLKRWRLSGLRRPHTSSKK
ncbi:hypothetical protein GQX74_014286 [Glossina fuscipes]|nr:hypothetical protein GQX74_014286 [Glossina fuscipes]